MLSIFAHVYCHFSVFLFEVSVQIFCSFYYWFFVFLLSCKSSLYILDTSTLLDIVYFEYFLPSDGLPFDFLNGICVEQKVLILMNLSNFSFMIEAFGSCCKTCYVCVV